MIRISHDIMDILLKTTWKSSGKRPVSLSVPFKKSTAGGQKYRTQISFLTESSGETRYNILAQLLVISTTKQTDEHGPNPYVVSLYWYIAVNCILINSWS